MQYFGYVRYNFDEVVKAIIHTELLDTELAWYSPNACYQLYIYSLEHAFGIHGFRPTWPCLIVELLETSAKFLQLFGYCNVIKCSFTFFPTNVFNCFDGVMAQFLLVKHKFSNESMLHSHQCSFRIVYGVKQWTTCKCTNYHKTTNHSGYLLWTGSVMRYMCAN